jgi:hypothetical protein
MSATPSTALPPEPVKPWLGKEDSIIQFLCDHGTLYCSQHHSLSAVSPEPDRLEVTAPPHKGRIVITGPAARELCACLCSGRATMIRTDGTDIREVTFLPDEDDPPL